MGSIKQSTGEASLYFLNLLNERDLGWVPNFTGVFKNRPNVGGESFGEDLEGVGFETSKYVIHADSCCLYY